MGPKPLTIFSCLVAAMAVVVRPWKAPPAVMIRQRSGCPVSYWYFRTTLDRAFPCLDAGIGEKHRVGEGVLGEPLGKPALVGDFVIGDVPTYPGLLGQRRDQMRMAVAKRVDGDAAGEVEVAVAIGLDQPDTLAPLDCRRKHTQRSRKAPNRSLSKSPAPKPRLFTGYTRFSRRSREKSKGPPAAAFHNTLFVVFTHRLVLLIPGIVRSCVTTGSASARARSSCSRVVRRPSMPGLPLGRSSARAADAPAGATGVLQDRRHRVHGGPCAGGEEDRRVRARSRAAH